MDRDANKLMLHCTAIAVALAVSLLLLGAGFFVLTHLSLLGAFVALGALAVVWAVIRFLPGLFARASTDRLQRAGAIEETNVSSFQEHKRRRERQRQRSERGTGD